MRLQGRISLLEKAAKIRKLYEKILKNFSSIYVNNYSFVFVCQDGIVRVTLATMKAIYCYVCRAKNRRILYRKGKYSIFKCLSCGFIYTDPIPSKVQLEEFYKNFDYKNKEIAELTIRKDAMNSLKRIRQYIKNEQVKLLDIGCGRGFFLDEARKLGWNVYGIDYSENVIDYAIKKLNLDVERTDMFNYHTKELYDVVSLNQVIEHVSDPDKIIKKCFKLLKKGGILYIATPNIGSISAKVLGSDFDHLIPPEHLGYFDKNLLIRSLKDNDFSVQYLGSWSYSVDLAGIIKKLLYKNKHSIETPMNKSMDSVGSSNQSRVKQIKYFLFDKFFCGIFYKVLNLDSFGIMLDAVAIKK